MNEVVDVKAAKAKSIRQTAYVLLACAAAVPLVTSFAGRFSSEVAGVFLGRATVVFALAAFAIRRGWMGQSPVAKAYGLLALCGGLLCWSVASTVLTTDAANNSKAQRSTVEVQAKELLASFQRHLVAIDKDLNSIDLSDALTPAGLTSAAAISASRAKITQYLSTLDERDQAIKKYRADIEALARNVDLDEDFRQGMVKGFNSTSTKWEKVFEEIGTSQRDLLASMTAMLDFAEANLGKSQMHDGQLAFQKPGQSERYNALVVSVQASAAREETAEQHLRQMQQASAQPK